MMKFLAIFLIISVVSVNSHGNISKKLKKLDTKLDVLIAHSQGDISVPGTCFQCFETMAESLIPGYGGCIEDGVSLGLFECIGEYIYNNNGTDICLKGCFCEALEDIGLPTIIADALKDACDEIS